MSQWHNAKVQRAKELGGFRCEDCGLPLTYRTAVGHHERYRRDGGKDNANNCRLRCKSCETSDPHASKGNYRGKKSHDYNEEQRVWRHYCKTGRLPRR